jgi:hypothetical protein
VVEVLVRQRNMRTHEVNVTLTPGYSNRAVATPRPQFVSTDVFSVTPGDVVFAAQSGCDPVTCGIENDWRLFARLTYRDARQAPDSEEM